MYFSTMSVVAVWNRLSKFFGDMVKVLRMQYVWFIPLVAWTIPFELVNVAVGLASYYYYTKLFTETSGVMATYGTDPISFLIVGLAGQGFLTMSALRMYQNAVSLYAGSVSVGGSRLSMGEYLSMANISHGSYFLASLIPDYFREVIMFLLYVGVGRHFFGLKFSANASYAAASVSFLISVLTMIGLGLISASMVWLVGAWHGTEPITWALSLLSNIASGVYFPVEVLPEKLKIVSRILPQTYAMYGLKLPLLGGKSLGEIKGIVAVQLVFLCIILPSGIYLYRLSKRVMFRRGSLAR